METVFYKSVPDLFGGIVGEVILEKPANGGENSIFLDKPFPYV